MESIIIVLLVVNLAILGLVLVRTSPTSAGNSVAAVRAELQRVSEQNRIEFANQRSEIREFQQGFDRQVESLRRESADRLDTMISRLQSLSERNIESHAELKKTLRQEVDTMRRSNEEKLDKMREVVDEKLQGTLEKRLGESFALVSERLERVQKGLGEMQTLASDVGGLKRVLTNVKSRGTWGEVQLERQLEDILSHGQYERNVVIKTGTRESVEFAIRLPGAVDGETVYLPIDSKFPQEDYERLLDAQDAGDKDLVVVAMKNLERAVLAQAKLISEKYINPPASTDFAIMYLPTEGLFAEVIRIPGFVSVLQNQYRVIVSGPTLFATLLNSLQMGFRTLAIEKRSSEVWQVLSAAKAEFKKYGEVWDKLGRQLETAQNTVKEAGVRTRAVERQLKGVESFDSADAITATVFDDFVETTATGQEPDVDG